MKIVLSILFLVPFLSQTWGYPETQSFKEGPNCEVCTKEYLPVCGLNGQGNKKTFGNDCLLELWNCFNGDDYVLISQGVCPATELLQLTLKDSLECDIVCTALYDPVCAENIKGEQRTFGNSCNVSQHNCKSNDKFHIIYKGECNELTFQF